MQQTPYETEDYGRHTPILHNFSSRRYLADQGACGLWVRDFPNVVIGCHEKQEAEMLYL